MIGDDGKNVGTHKSCDSLLRKHIFLFPYTHNFPEIINIPCCFMVIFAELGGYFNNSYIMPGCGVLYDKFDEKWEQ